MSTKMTPIAVLLPRRTASEAVEIGRRLLLLKEESAHGEFTGLCESIGCSHSSANKYMAIARRFHDAPERLLLAAGGLRKLVELLALEDDELEALGQGDEVRGLSLQALAGMTVRQVREAMHVGQYVQSTRLPDGAGGSNTATSRHSGGVQQVREQQTDYCRRLGKVITRYLTPDELRAYGEHLEAFAAQVTACRPAQGLHDASYHLRMRFKMPGAVPDSAD